MSAVLLKNSPSMRDFCFYIVLRIIFFEYLSLHSKNVNPHEGKNHIFFM